MQCPHNPKIDCWYFGNRWRIIRHFGCRHCCFKLAEPDKANLSLLSRLNSRKEWGNYVRWIKVHEVERMLKDAALEFPIYKSEPATEVGYAKFVAEAQVWFKKHLGDVKP